MKNEGNQITVLFVLLCVLISLFFYTGICKPKLEQIDALKNQIETEAFIIKSRYDTVILYNETYEEVNRLKTIFDSAADSYYKEEVQSDYLFQLEQWLNDSSLTFDAIDVSEETEFDIKPFAEVIGEHDGGEAVASGEEVEHMIGISQTEISVSGFGTYRNFDVFMNQLSEHEKKVVCDNLIVEETPQSIEEGAIDSTVKYTVVLKFLQVDERVTNEELPALPQGFVMPEEFLNGAYRKTFSLKNILETITN